MTSVPAAGRTCALLKLKERDTMLLGSMSLARWPSRILCRLIRLAPARPTSDSAWSLLQLDLLLIQPGPHPASLPQPGPNPISLLLQPSGSTYLLVSLVPTPTHFLCGILTSVSMAVIHVLASFACDFQGCRRGRWPSQHQVLPPHAHARIDFPEVPRLSACHE